MTPGPLLTALRSLFPAGPVTVCQVSCQVPSNEIVLIVPLVSRAKMFSVLTPNVVSAGCTFSSDSEPPRGSGACGPFEYQRWTRCRVASSIATRSRRPGPHVTTDGAVAYVPENSTSQFCQAPAS